MTDTERSTHAQRLALFLRASRAYLALGSGRTEVREDVRRDARQRFARRHGELGWRSAQRGA